jgi:hypothetical protein
MVIYCRLVKPILQPGGMSLIAEMTFTTGAAAGFANVREIPAIRKTPIATIITTFTGL